MTARMLRCSAEVRSGLGEANEAVRVRCASPAPHWNGHPPVLVGGILLTPYWLPAQRVRMMTSSAEECWRLSRDCGRWAAETRDGSARLAFRQMATAWGRLAFSEEFTSPDDEKSCATTAEDQSSTAVKSITVQTARQLLQEIERAQMLRA
jgi:hypothetical protein